jgi:hypothetical protein
VTVPRIENHGLDLRQIDAVVISHRHPDLPPDSRYFEGDAWCRAWLWLEGGVASCGRPRDAVVGA